MKVVVTGATGNVGTSVLDALLARDEVTEVVGLARRPADPREAVDSDHAGRLSLRSADVVTERLEPIFEGADAVVHLAWLIQPSRDLEHLRAVNVEGSRRVFEAAARAGVGRLVHASSIGAYSPGPDDRPVDESWPTGGIETSFYSRHKSEAETLLDAVEAENPELRVVRLRPGLIFKRDAATEIRRYFLGPFVPGSLLRRRLIPVVPRIAGLRFQAVHTTDVGEAYALAVTEPKARGAYNIAARPVLDPERLAELLGARAIGVPARAVRAAADLTWRLRLQPTPPGWLDMALGVPIMDTTRAREELGWEPSYDGGEALLELLEGFNAGAGRRTPPLDPATSGPLRSREVGTGIGRKSP